MTYILLATAVALSSVAAYYSIVGLMAIFAAAQIPIAIMGSTLEVAKIVTATWLKRNWKETPILLRTYFVVAIAVLMLITSAGIFGFLSKAYLEQNLVSGNVSAKVEIIDEKIKVSRENIEVNRKALKQLDDAVDQVMARSSSETGADKAVSIRRSQAKERARLLQEIEAEQKKISQFTEERAPLAAEIRKVEAEVGPIKYVAALLYDDANNKETLDKSVRILILLIVFTFDPLAVLMFIAVAQAMKKKEPEPKEEAPVIVPAPPPAPPPVLYPKIEETIEEDPIQGETEEWKERISRIENSTPWPTTWEKDEDEIPVATESKSSTLFIDSEVRVQDSIEVKLT
jgi:hypothetical protein